MTALDYQTLLATWGVEFAGEDSSCPMDGSPERSAARTVVKDRSGGRWILEQIEPDNSARKQRVAEQLERLEKSGLEQIHPWLRTTRSSFFQTARGEPVEPLEKNNEPSCHEFMLRPYIDGLSLDRKTYLNDSWRIEAMARFLIQLQVHTSGWSGPKFSITAYAEARMTEWRRHYSKLAEKLEGSFGKLHKNFFPVHDRLPVAFCHGDYHPLNMIWGEGEIRSVIDWEFCGIKPELYDVALLLGCIGFEDPDHLIKPPAIQLVQTLRSAGFGTPVSWDHLLDLMAVIRYGWMSEWIRRSDKEARQMEAVYIDILVDQKDYIQQRWQM